MSLDVQRPGATATDSSAASARGQAEPAPRDGGRPPPAWCSSRWPQPSSCLSST